MAYKVTKTVILRSQELWDKYPELVSWWCKATDCPFMINDCFAFPLMKIHELNRGYLIEWPQFDIGRNTTVFMGVTEIPYEKYHLISHLFR